MHRVHSTPDAAVAHLVRDALARHGIAAVVRGEQRGALAGETAWTDTWAEVWIGDDADRDAARALVAEVVAGPQDGAPWTCTGCGETVDGSFGACWNCGTDRPA